MSKNREKSISLMFLLFLTLVFLFAICFILLIIFDNKNIPTQNSNLIYDNSIKKEVVSVTQTPFEENPSIEGKYNHEEYQKKIDEIAQNHEAVSVSVALTDNGKVIDTFSFGDAIRDELKMTEDTKVRIASISKIFVGLAAMASVENGTMSLDEDIGKYWGVDVRTYADGDVITPRSILTHTSSLYDSEDMDDTYYYTTAYLLKSGNIVRNIVSGNIENYNYNNFAFDVLGMTIELANNKVLDEVLAEKIYKKLDIDAAFYGGDVNDTSNMATSYQADWSIGLTASHNASWHGDSPGSVGWGFAGGLTISAKDLGKIIALIANDGVYDGIRCLSEKSIKELENHEGNYVDGFWQCQPLCYKTNIYGQKEFYYHTGGAYGIYSLAGYNPNTKQGVVVLTSGADGQDDDNEITQICGEIADLLLNIGK